MITKEEQKQAQELLDSLIQKSWSSQEFKNQLIENPREIIANETGRDVSTIPSDKKIIVEDQTDESIIYLNIPPKPDYTNLELTDEQLEIVSGGEVMAVGWWVAVGVVCLVGGGAAGYAIGEAVK